MSKHHLRNLPPIKVPTEYPRDSTALALSLPIFYSPKSRKGFANYLFDENGDFLDFDVFEQVVCRAAVWTMTSIATNTDLCDKGMPIYFYVEDIIFERVSAYLKSCDVPDDWIRKFTSAETNTDLQEIHFGKKFAAFKDEELECDTLLVWDTDALVYRKQREPLFEWYDLFTSKLKNIPLLSFYAEWNGGDVEYVNWLLRGVGLKERVFNDDDPEKENLLILAENDAYERVGLQNPNRQFRYGSAIIGVPRTHPLFEYLAEHHEKSYSEEALVTMFMNANPGLDFALTDNEFVESLVQDNDFFQSEDSCICHIRGHNKADLPRYFYRLLKGADARRRLQRLTLPEVKASSKGRIHLLSVPHNPSHPDFPCCAFAQKARKDAEKYTFTGWDCFHYGNELSDVNCTENVVVNTEDDLLESYGEEYRLQSGFYQWSPEDYAYKQFYLRAEHELRKRYLPGDIIAYVFAPGLKVLYDRFQDLEGAIHVESGIGYPHPYAPFKVFESPSNMHFNVGVMNQRYEYWSAYDDEYKKENPRDMNTVVFRSEMQWYDAFIPNSVLLHEYDFSTTHDDYFLYLGRIIPAKGIEIAMRVSHALGKKLVIAGQGDFEKEFGFKPWTNVELVGWVDVEERRRLLANCIALFCLSTYPEPFGGVHIEAAISGKPSIGTLLGAYCHTIKHNLTGYKVKLNVFEQALWAAQNADKIDPETCRRWGQQFINERIAHKYDEYYTSLRRYVENGFSPYWITNPERDNLDWIDESNKWLSDPIIKTVDDLWQ